MIEVLAGLLVLGTLVVSVLIARGRFAAQMAQADERAAAIKALDAQVTTWLSGPPQNVPIGRQGALPDAPGAFWQTRLIHQPSADRLDAAVLHVVVFKRLTGSTRMLELASLDVLLHQQRPGASQ